MVIIIALALILEKEKNIDVDEAKSNSFATTKDKQPHHRTQIIMEKE